MNKFSYAVKYFKKSLEAPSATASELAGRLGMPEDGNTSKFLIEAFLKSGKTFPIPEFVTGDAFHKHTKWKVLRQRALRRYGKVCMKCHEFGDTVDHIYPRMKFPELALDMSNLQILCDLCNKKKGENTADYRPQEIRDLFKP